MFPSAKRILIIGDVHGDVERVIKCLKVSGVLNNEMQWVAQPQDTIVVQMGDQLDSKNRNPDLPLWENTPDTSLLTIMDSLDDLARNHGGRVISLLGNHELMNFLGDFSYVSDQSMTACGGPSARAHSLIRGSELAKSLERRYVVVRIGRYLFCHAGLLPCHLNVVGENIDAFNQAFSAFMRGTVTERQLSLVHETVCSMTGMLWTRKYMELASNVNQDDLKTTLSIVLQTTNCTTMFIGHNTVPKVTVIAGGALVFTDACFSRAYGSDAFQFIDILDDQMSVMQV